MQYEVTMSRSSFNVLYFSILEEAPGFDAAKDTLVFPQNIQDIKPILLGLDSQASIDVSEDARGIKISTNSKVIHDYALKIHEDDEKFSAEIQDQQELSGAAVAPIRFSPRSESEHSDQRNDTVVLPKPR